MYIKLYEV